MAAEGVSEQAGDMAGKAGGVAGKARKQAHELLRKLKKHRPGPLGWVALVALASALAIGSGIVLTLLSPLLLLFSPILIPVGIVLFLCTAGLVTVGGSGVAALSALIWIYRYFTGKHPRGSHQADNVVGHVHDTVDHMKHRAHDLASQIPMPTVE